MRLNYNSNLLGFKSEIIRWNPRYSDIELKVFYEIDPNTDLEYISAHDLDIIAIVIKNCNKRLQSISSKNLNQLLYLIDQQLDWDEIIRNEYDFRDNPYPH